MTGRTQHRQNTEGRELHCLKTEFINPETTFTGAGFASTYNRILQIPLQYFQRFVSSQLLHNVMVKSNEYSLQKYGTIADIAIKEVQ